MTENQTEAALPPPTGSNIPPPRKYFQSITPQTQSPWLGVIAAPPGMGKTTLALSAAGPYHVYVADTEMRAMEVVKQSYMDKVDKVHVRPIPDWDFLDHFASQVSEQHPGVVVFDSGTDLRNMAEKHVLDNMQGREKLQTFEWGAVDNLTGQIINKLRNKGFHILFTADVKERYVGNNATGLFEPRIRPYLVRRADFVLQHEIPTEDEPRNWVCTKSAWRPYEEWGQIRIPVIGSTLRTIFSVLRKPKTENET